MEFLLANYDYYDGNDLIAQLFLQNYHMIADEKIDGIHYSIIKLHDNLTEYELVWHEDIGNFIFCVEQDENSNSKLEHRLKDIVDLLNEKIH